MKKEVLYHCKAKLKRKPKNQNKPRLDGQVISWGKIYDVILSEKVLAGEFVKAWFQIEKGDEYKEPDAVALSKKAERAEAALKKAQKDAAEAKAAAEDANKKAAELAKEQDAKKAEERAKAKEAAKKAKALPEKK